LMGMLSGTHQQIDILKELDGSVSDFGGKFWELVKGKVPGFVETFSAKKLRTGYYSDRYLTNPAAVFLFHMILKDMPFAINENGSFELNTMEAEHTNRNDPWRTVNKNWVPADGNAKKDMIRELLVSTGRFNEVVVRLSINKKTIGHARLLRLEFEGGSSIEIRFDQGMGAWYIEPKSVEPVYPFGAAADLQTAWLIKQEVRMIARVSQHFGTHVFVRWEQKGG